jgi:hypothetical protein
MKAKRPLLPPDLKEALDETLLLHYHLLPTLDLDPDVITYKLGSKDQFGRVPTLGFPQPCRSDSAYVELRASETGADLVICIELGDLPSDATIRERYPVDAGMELRQFRQAWRLVQAVYARHHYNATRF